MSAATATMNATAEFFAKKRKKRPYRFNANLVDVNSLLSTTHVDAPALSTEEHRGNAGAAAAPMPTIDEGTNNNAAATNTAEATNAALADQQWDDAAVVTTTRKVVTTTTTTTSTTGTGKSTEQAPVMDMKSLQSSNPAQDNIAEKLRIEETKKQLAAARQGMEREAQKIALEKEKKAAAAAEKAAAAATAPGGRWVAPHMRNNTMQASRLPGAAAARLDTASEELFPDLQKAEQILEQKEKAQNNVVRVPKKTPVGGGATWASKPKKVAAKAPSKPAAAAAKAPSKPAAAAAMAAAPKPAAAAPKEQQPSKPKEPEPPAPAAPEPPAPAPVIQPKITRKTGTKKKKKDLSTFKPGGAP